MRTFSRAVFLLLVLLAGALPVHAVRVEIESPDHETTYPWSRVVDREIRWSARDRSLLAVVTFNSDSHADALTPGGNEDLWFRFPGTALKDGKITVTAPTGETIAIGQSSKTGKGVALYTNTLIIVTRTGGRIRLTLSVDTGRDPAAGKPKDPADQPQSAPLDDLIHGH